MNWLALLTMLLPLLEALLKLLIPTTSLDKVRSGDRHKLAVAVKRMQEICNHCARLGLSPTSPEVQTSEGDQ